MEHNFLRNGLLRWNGVIPQRGCVKYQTVGKKKTDDEFYSHRLVGTLLLQLPIPADVMWRGNRVDRARQCLRGAVLVRIHRRDQGFLTDLGWDWRWEKPLLNWQSALRSRSFHQLKPVFLQAYDFTSIFFLKEQLDLETGHVISSESHHPHKGGTLCKSGHPLPQFFSSTC